MDKRLAWPKSECMQVKDRPIPVYGKERDHPFD